MIADNIEGKLTEIEKKLDQLSQDKSGSMINEVARVLKREKDLALLTSADYQTKLMQWWHYYDDSLSSSIEDEPVNFLARRKIGGGLPPMIDFSTEKTNRYIVFEDQYNSLIARHEVLERYCQDLTRYKEELERHITHLESSKYDENKFSKYFEYYRKSSLELNEYISEVKMELEDQKLLTSKSGFWGKLIKRRLKYQEDWYGILELANPRDSIEFLYLKLNEFSQKLDNDNDRNEMIMFLTKTALLRKDYEVGFITENYFLCAHNVQVYFMIEKVRKICAPMFSIL